MGNKIEQRIAGRAAIRFKGKILIIRESSSYDIGSNIGRYDLPGGRIEPGESLQNGLVREVKEECGLKIEVGKPFFVGEWRPMIKGTKVQIIAIYFRCLAKNSKVILGSDHDDYKWIALEKYDDYDLVPPNKEVLRELIRNERCQCRGEIR